MKATNKKESAAHKKIAAELSSLIPSLDEEGLSFLVQQAYVHLHNMEVDRYEKSIEDTSADEKTDARTAGSRPSERADKARRANYRIERSSSGASYHIVSGGKWKMYTEDEMMAMVRIVQSDDPVSEVAARLHAWFTEERPDTFVDLEIGDRHDPRLAELVLFIRGKFAIKNGRR